MALTRAVSDFKDSVKAATTTNITISGGAPTTVDGISLSANDSVLVKSQTDPTQNGLYRVTTLGTGSNGSWTRRSDFNASNQVSAGALIFVEQGSINGNVFYYLPGGLGTVSIGSTALNFSNLFTTISSDISTGGGGGGTTYSNTNVAAYLSTFQGALTANNFNAVAVYANTIGNSGATLVGFNAALTGALTANNFNAVAVYAGTLGNAGSNLVGTLLTASQTNITSVGTLSSLSVNGAITGNSFTGIALYAGTIGNSGATLVGTLNGAANGPLNGTLGATTPNSVIATSITTSSGGQVTGYHTGAIGANTANTGAFTTLTTTGNITATGYIIPSANVTYDLGTPTLRWRTLYLSGNTIDLGGTSLSLGTGGLLVPSLTANASVLGNTFAGIAVYANTIGNTGSTLVGSIGTNAQPYITSVGTLNSLAVSGAVTGNTFTSVAVYAGTIGNTGATLTGSLSTASQPSLTTLAGLTSFGSSGGMTTAQGNLTVTGNLTVSGNINTTGNVYNTTIIGNSGQFFGNAAGFNSFYAGISTGYFIEPQMAVQISSNFNGYAGLNMQNINSGTLASTDLFWTPNNGTANDTFLDIGIGSSTYSFPGYGLINPNDAYIIAYGNTTTQGGNLILNTGTSNDIIFATNGSASTNEVMRITRANVVNIKSTLTSTSITTGALVLAGGAGITGNVYANSFNGISVYANTVGNTGATLVGVIGTNAQPFITSVGTLSSIAVTGSIQGNTHTGVAIYANTIGNTGATLVGVIGTNAQPFITSLGTLTSLTSSGNIVAASGTSSTSTTTGALVVTGGTGISGNLYVGGNVILGSVLTYTPLNSYLQIGSNVNSYVQVAIQNANSGINASTDIAAIANNGSDNDTYVDMGITSSTYNQSAYNLYGVNDGYLIVSGNTTTNGGNLILNTYNAKDIIFATGGTLKSNEIGRFRANTNSFVIGSNTSSTSISTGALIVTGGAGITGNVNVGGNASVGNITGLVGGIYWANGTAFSSGSGGGGSGTYSNTNVSQYLPVYNGNIAAGNITGIVGGIYWANGTAFSSGSGSGGSSSGGAGIGGGSSSSLLATGGVLSYKNSIGGATSPTFAWANGSSYFDTIPQSSSTNIYIDNIDYTGTTRTAYFRSISSGVLTVRSVATPANYMVFSINANIGDATGFTSYNPASRIQVTPIYSTVSNFTAEEFLTFTFPGDVVVNSLTINGNLTLGGSTGTAGYILASSGPTTAPIWRDPIRTSSQTGAVSSVTIDPTTYDYYTIIGLSSNITFAATTTFPSNDKKVLLRIKDNGTSRAITWTSGTGGFRAIGITLPTVTTANKLIYIGVVWNYEDSIWDAIAYSLQA